MAFDHSGFGKEVRVAVADVMEALYRIGDIGGIFVVLEHVCLNPDVSVCFSAGPGSSAVDPDAEMLGGMEVSCIEACGERALVILHYGLAIVVECAR